MILIPIRKKKQEFRGIEKKYKRKKEIHKRKRREF